MIRLKSLPHIHLRAGGIKRGLYDVLLQFCYTTVTKLHWLLPYVLLALYYEKETWNPSRYRLQEPSSRKTSRWWTASRRSAHWSAREGLAYASSRRTQLWWTRRNRRDARFRTTWTKDLLMYGQDLYFVTAVAVVGFVFLIVAMVLERIFDRWKVLSRQPWLFSQYCLYYRYD